MSLPEHLHPKTYWEHRCGLTEELIGQLMRRLVRHLPTAAHDDLQSLVDDWAKLLGEITAKFPPSPEQTP